MQRVPVTGRVHDAAGRGVPGVAVSDGVAVTTSDADGHYRLLLDRGRRHTSLVQITVPALWRVPCDDSHLPGFFRPAADTVDFVLYADPPAADPAYRFLALTDVHVPDPALFARATDLVPDARFVVVSGDLTDDAAPAEFAAFRAAAGRSAVPVWPAPGNHDLVGQGRRGPQPVPGRDPGLPYRDAIEGYRAALGPEWYSFQYGVHHFVVLENFRGLAEPDQMVWLEDDLALAGDRQIVVVAHVPWNVPQTPPPSLTSAYLDLFGRHDVRLLIAGHSHVNDVTPDLVGRARQVVTTAPASSTLDHTPGGFRVVAWDGDHVSTRFVELAEPSSGSTPPPDRDAVPPVPGAGWPMFRGGPGHHGASVDVVSPPLRLAWVHRTGGTILTSSPAVAGGAVFAGVRDEHGTGTNGVAALDLATGERRWWAPMPGPVAASVAVAACHLVLAPAARGPLRALDAATGQPRWEWHPEPGEPCWMYYSPTVVDSVVHQAYVLRGGAGVAALDARDGRERWRTTEPIGRSWISHASPAVAGDRLFFATAYANLVSVDAARGTIRWQRVLGGGLKVGAAPVLAGGLVLLARHGDRLVAVDAGTGRERWHYQAPGEALRPAPDTTATPAVGDGVAYGGFTDGSVAAVDLATGALRWRFQTGGPVLSSPAVSGTVLYVGSQDGHLRALDRTTGTVRWSHRLASPVASSPAVTGNAVVVATWNGHIHAFTAG